MSKSSFCHLWRRLTMSYKVKSWSNSCRVLSNMITYHTAGKFGRELNLVVWWSACQIKIGQYFTLAYIRWYCTKLPNLNPPIIIINPRRMREGYSSRSVCVSVCYHASCYIPRLYVENKVPLAFLWHFQRMYCVDFVENALFKTSGNICWSPLPSTLLDELSMVKRDSDVHKIRRKLGADDWHGGCRYYIHADIWRLTLVVNKKLWSLFVVKCDLL